MNCFLPPFFRAGLLLTAGFSIFLARAAADVEPVQSPTKRHDTIEKAKAFLAPKAMPTVTADPFHSDAFYLLVSGGNRPPVETPTTPQVGPRSDRDLLQAMAANLKPNGFFVLGGQPTLVFGQKRVKAGSTMTITFEGTDYTLAIVSVDHSNFTLRLNREEFTRPIK